MHALCTPRFACLRRMEEAPKVSVIIPCHNSALFIRETIESLLLQSWSNLEVIVVDDHSTDSSLNIVNSINDQRILVLESPRYGAAAARNVGLEQSSGFYIQYLDSDDLLSPEKIESQLLELIDAEAQGDSMAVASCPWIRFRDTPVATDVLPEPVWRDYDDPKLWLRDAWEGGGMMQTACWLLPVAVTNAAGRWNEGLSLHDDGEYFSRVLLSASSIRFCSNAIVWYRSGVESSLSRQADRSAAESAFQVCRLYEEHARHANELDLYRRGLTQNYLTFIYQFYPEQTDLVARARSRQMHLGATWPPLRVGGPTLSMLSLVIGPWQAIRVRSLFARILRRLFERR